MLDRWVLSELNRLVRDVDAAMDGFDTRRAGSRLTAFVDDLRVMTSAACPAI